MEASKRSKASRELSARPAGGRWDHADGAGPPDGAVVRLETYGTVPGEAASCHTSLAYASTLVCDTPRLCVGLRERPGLEGKRPGPELWDLRVGHFS